MYLWKSLSSLSSSSLCLTFSLCSLCTFLALLFFSQFDFSMLPVVTMFSFQYKLYKVKCTCYVPPQLWPFGSFWPRWITLGARLTYARCPPRNGVITSHNAAHKSPTNLSSQTNLDCSMVSLCQNEEKIIFATEY